MSGCGRTAEQLPIFFLPMAPSMAAMPQLLLCPTPPLVDAIHLPPVEDEAKTHRLTQSHSSVA